MIKEQIKQILDKNFAEGVRQGLWTAAVADSYTVELPKHAGHGDFSTNMAMVIAGRERKKPREIASLLAEKLGAHTELFTGVEIAGPGFINFFVRNEVWQSVVQPVCEQGYKYGFSQGKREKKVLVEFVSANPTGPLSIDTAARLFWVMPLPGFWRPPGMPLRGSITIMMPGGRCVFWGSLPEQDIWSYWVLILCFRKTGTRESTSMILPEN